ncbi:MAG: phosphatidate cytidylyltransferase [Candidatus Saccharibacteria bacterium]|nr:phosphatidate cytidylyltransferase [Candidatus Saccharibacteria bacterium]
MAYNLKMAFIFTVIAVGLLLVGSELFWRHFGLHGEFSRKFVHITVGSFVAFWPFFLSWGEIEVLSLAFLVVIGISKYLNVFKVIHSVQRPTFGELFFALAVGVIAVMTHDKHIYTVALLQMSLADGLAAVVGTRFGHTTRYHVVGQAKSVVGSLTFLVVSLAILIAYSGIVQPVNLGVLGGIAILATIIENIGVQGLDNLLVPVLAAWLLALAA